MKINPKKYAVKDLTYTLRSPIGTDAKKLSMVRVQIDGETENLDRVPGEDYLDEKAFKQLIKKDTESKHNLFLISEVNGIIVGFSRCEGNELKRTSHRVNFGVCVLKQFWGYGIGQNLLKLSINWAKSNDIKKMLLSVLETNEKAIKLYKKQGFEMEGILRNDKILSDGKYYNTILMGRLFES